MDIVRSDDQAESLVQQLQTYPNHRALESFGAVEYPGKKVIKET